MHTRTLLAVLTVCLSLASLAPAQEPSAPAPAELADRLPADTFLYARIPSLADAWAGFRSLPLYRAWQDEEVQGFLDASGDAIEKLLAGVGGDRKVLERLMSLPEMVPGEAVMAVFRPGDDVGWLACFTAPSEEKAGAFAREVVQPLLASVSFGAPVVGRKDPPHYTAFHGPTRTLAMAVDGPRVLIASDAADLTRVLLPTAPAAKRLSANPAFREARGRVAPGAHALFLYLDITAIPRDESDRRALEISGIAGLHTIAAGLVMTEGRAREAIWLGCPDGRKGLFGAFPGTRVDLDAARLAPDNALAFFAGSIRPSDLHRVIYELSGEGLGGMLRPVRALDGKLEKEMGARALADLVGLLGTEVCAYAALPRSGGPWPEVAGAIEVLQPDKLQMSLDALVRTLSGAAPKSLDYRGRQIRYLAPGGGGFELSSCWCVTDGYLLVSYHPTILKGLIKRLEGTGKTLVDDEEFIAARKALPEGSVAVGYLHTQRIFRYLYGLLLPFLSAAGDDLPIDVAALPSTEAVAQHLSFALSGLTAEKTGLTLRTESDGYGPTSLAVYGMLAATLFLDLPEMRENGLRRNDACGYELGQIHGWIEDYRQRNGRYPAKLADLDIGDDWRANNARCDAAQRVRVEKQKIEWNDRKPHWEDFGYVVAAGTEPPAKLADGAMLIWDSAPRHNGGRLVLLAGGEMTWMREAVFQGKLAEQGR